MGEATLINYVSSEGSYNGEIFELWEADLNDGYGPELYKFGEKDCFEDLEAE